MKKARRIAAMIAAMAMAATLAAPSFMMTASAETGTTITMNDAQSGTKFSAYQILTLTTSVSGDNTEYTYAVNSKYRNILKNLLEVTDADAAAADGKIIQKLGALIGDTGISAADAGTARKFADDLYAAIAAAGSSIGADVTTENGTFTDVSQGYYLIVETATTGDGGTLSLAMLDTKDGNNITVTTKKDKPTFEKNIKDTNDSTDPAAVSDWQKTADYDIGDAVPFQLVATLPDDYANYKEYKLVFHDDLKKSAADKDVFNRVAIQKVYADLNDNGTCDAGEAFTADDYAYDTTTSATHKTGFDCDFEVKFANLKTSSLKGSLDKEIKVIVEYTAVLTDDAVIGAVGNWNGAYLEYSNNPYYETPSGSSTDDTPTSETPEDTVVAFTYQTIVNKVKPDNTPLAGAGFTLYKYVPTDAEANSDGYIVVAAIAPSDSTTTFSFVGLDAGQYKLSETATPSGYASIEDTVFTIDATHGENATTHQLELLSLSGNKVSGEVEFAADKDAGTLEASVVNHPNSQLPSTGGMGTALFILGGGVTAAAAGIYLVSKKRSKDAE